MKLKILLFFIFCFTIVFSQNTNFNYERDIIGIQDQWHTIPLPNSIYNHLSSDLSDLRIYGINENKDTIEAPYFLNIHTNKTTSKTIDFEIINKSKTEDGFYFTFKVPSLQTINQIKLNFSNINFDWKIKLEGSQNLKEWVEIIKDYRIVSIKNKHTNYHFSTIYFPVSSYKYFKIFIKSKEQPILEQPQLIYTNQLYNLPISHSIQSFKVKNNPKKKQTIINVKLDKLVPISYLDLQVINPIDYFRPILIEYISDSLKTEKGWKYNYEVLASGTLNSVYKKPFTFKNKILQNLKITIENHDNQPLKIKKIDVKGSKYELIARFDEKASYKLTYGNSNLSFPQYDINNFKNTIPKNLKPLSLGNEISINDEKKTKDSTFFNQIWLWIIMLLIIIILGWFSIKMLQENTTN